MKICSLGVDIAAIFDCLELYARDIVIILSLMSGGREMHARLCLQTVYKNAGKAELKSWHSIILQCKLLTDKSAPIV